MALEFKVKISSTVKLNLPELGTEWWHMMHTLSNVHFFGIKCPGPLVGSHMESPPPHHHHHNHHHSWTDKVTNKLLSFALKLVPNLLLTIKDL